MSCNGCRVLRKGCSDNCMLRQSIQWMEDPQAQAHATIFVAKFFGRAGLFSFINAVSESQRPVYLFRSGSMFTLQTCCFSHCQRKLKGLQCEPLFQSLLFEAVGRTINPVNGATGLLLSGKWEVCQAAVETVLRGGALESLPEYTRDHRHQYVHDDHHVRAQQRQLTQKRRRNLAFDDIDDNGDVANCQPLDLDLCLKAAAGFTSRTKRRDCRAGTPSSVEESETTTLGSASSENCNDGNNLEATKLLRLFI